MSYAPTQYYAPPGTDNDPWGPYIREASARFDVPERWIRAVMAQESGGQEQAVSPAGAIGLMQVMPDTYAELQQEYLLGPDPFNPEDNILAGTAYIKEMYDRYGAPGFLAAYNAGPQALDDYLAGNGDLPDETVNYLASVAPELGDSAPMTGPLAGYANGTETMAVLAPSAANFALGCDVDAAYDPDHPCTATEGAQAVADVHAGAGVCNPNAAYDPDSPCTAAQGGTGSCDADAAYDPDSPCTPVNETQPAPAAQTASALYQPAPVEVSAAVPVPPLADEGGDWAVQVGAYANEGLARAVAEGAQAEAGGALANASIALPPTSPFGGLVLYRARLTGLSASAAAQACATLNGRQLPCVVVPASSA